MKVLNGPKVPTARGTPGVDFALWALKEGCLSQSFKAGLQISLIIHMNLFTKQKQIHRYRKQTYGYQRGKGGGGDKLGVWN